jgi:hypothetical protein
VTQKRLKKTQKDSKRHYTTCKDEQLNEQREEIKELIKK